MISRLPLRFGFVANASTLIALCAFLCGCTTVRSDSIHPAQKRRVRAGAAWDDPIRCEEAVRAGARFGRARFRMRVGTWSLRFFPDGSMDGSRWPTDVDWLACTIAWLDVDLLALQEVKLTSSGQRALGRLVAELGELTNTEWRWVSDSCPASQGSHVVMLYRADRLKLTLVATHTEVDPTARARGPSNAGVDCSGIFRPALAAYVESRRGDLDFHFLTLQLDAGTGERDFANRKHAWHALEQIRSQRARQRPDDDFVIAADFNSAGCPRRGIAGDAAEREALRGVLSTFSSPLVLAEPTDPCSAIGRVKSQLLDHIVFSSAMKEARGSTSRVVGLCAAARCMPVAREAALALTRLSDHCPILFDLMDHDEH